MRARYCLQNLRTTTKITILEPTEREKGRGRGSERRENGVKRGVNL